MDDIYIIIYKNMYKKRAEKRESYAEKCDGGDIARHVIPTRFSHHPSSTLPRVVFS